MNTTEGILGAALLDALEAFDKQTLPLGLYACDEFRMKDRPFHRLHQKWHLCLAPCLKALDSHQKYHERWQALRRKGSRLATNWGARCTASVGRTRGRANPEEPGTAEGH